MKSVLAATFAVARETCPPPASTRRNGAIQGSMTKVSLSDVVITHGESSSPFSFFSRMRSRSSAGKGHSPASILHSLRACGAFSGTTQNMASPMAEAMRRRLKRTDVGLSGLRGSTKRRILPPQIMSDFAASLLVRSKSTNSTASPSRTRFPASMAFASMAPPPMVPATMPSGPTSMAAPACLGDEALCSTTLTRAALRPKSISLQILSSIDILFLSRPNGFPKKQSRRIPGEYAAHP